MELLPQVAELDGIKRDLGILGRHYLLCKQRGWKTIQPLCYF